MIRISLILLAGVTGLNDLADLISEMVPGLVGSSDLFLSG